MTEWEKALVQDSKHIQSVRTYRVLISCDQTRQGLQLKIDSTASEPVQDVKNKLRQAFELILDRIHISGA